MIRAQLMHRGQESRNGFRLRGTDITRLEGFSDAVFGFAVTLLVVSLVVPTDFDKLVATMRDLLPFAMCFGILCTLWYDHYLFFRRYGLHDATMVALNSLLLFVILAYVYPLKFLFRELVGFIGAQLGMPTQPTSLSLDQLATLFVIYGLGWVAVYALFALFYLHAYRLHASLELSALEAFDTRANICSNLAMAAIGLLSVLLALLNVGVTTGLAGWLYILIAPVQMIYGSWAKARRRALAQRLPMPAAGAGEDASAPDSSS